MTSKTSRLDITDLISININNYRNLVWLHIKRRDRTVSLTSKDFSKLLKKSGEIKRLIQKHERAKKPNRRDDTEAESTDAPDSD